MPTLLNVGAGSKHKEIPSHYTGWEHRRLDIDPGCGADIVCDARELRERVPPASCDAVYCSHNLEHYYPHDGERVLLGFVHVLKPDGFAEIRVPDIGEVLRAVASRGLDLEDELYASPAGPIRVLDVVYGWQEEIARSSKEFYAHKTGFTAKSMARALSQAGFATAFLVPPMAMYELRVFAFRQAPTEVQRRLLGIDS